MKGYNNKILNFMLHNCFLDYCCSLRKCLI